MNGALFDMLELRQTRKPASVRNVIGELAELLACEALGYQRQRIDGRKKLCADAETPDGKPVEIKSVGKNGRALIYKWRLEKELATLGREYRYVFVRHHCPVTMPNAGAVADYFRDNPPKLLLCTLGDIIDTIGDKPSRTFRIFTGETGTTEPQKFNRRTMHGTQRAGYVDGGWQFALSAIQTQPGREFLTEWRGQKISIQTDTTAAAK